MCEISEVSDSYSYDDTYLSTEHRLKEEDHKTIQIFKKTKEVHFCSRDYPSQIGGRVEGKAGISWGGKDGVEYSISGSAKIRDYNGNSVDLVITQKSDGKGDAFISTGIDIKPKDQKDPGKIK